MKTIIVIAAHGAPATDCPRRTVGMFMALESMPRLVNRFGFLQRLKQSLEHKVRSWPRSPENDPYREGVKALAERLAAQTGNEVIAGYLEFCAPDIGTCIDEAAGRGAAKVIVVTTMTTRGGGHSETEIREIAEEAQKRHPGVQIMYAWPFDPDRVARFFAEEIARFAM
jgi:sirohydrochlorin cobaltochelatase